MRIRVNFICLLFGFCCVGGCSASDSWISVDEDQVINRFGLPDKSYTSHDKKYLLYNFSNINYAFNIKDIVIHSDEDSQNKNCIGTFVINDGVVEKLKVQGSDCLFYQ